MLVTLSTMRTRIRQRADMASSTFIEDSELNQYINASFQELYDILATTYQDYYTLAPVEFTIASGNTYDIASNFYKLRGVDATDDGIVFYNLSPFEFTNRNKTNTDNTVLRNTVEQKKFRLVGSKLYITPVDQAPGDYRIWYIPQATTLSDDSDTLDGVNGWEEYIVVDCVRKCLQKEETDTAYLVGEKEALRQRIMAAALDRDAGAPKRITDIYDFDPFERWNR